MDEEALFSAYRFLRSQELRDPLVDVNRYGLLCIVRPCMTRVALSTGRVMCRYHERKRREEQQP